MCHLTLLVGRLAVVGGVEVPVAADSSHVDGTIGALSGVAFNGGGGGEEKLGEDGEHFV
eukprot:CAMPEP_0179456520 /NCGR_PEP_ID=MMETSP0799-20121207/40348_1 /TAXON_ID=46947 /ORGANISM="Geminigera cryophila, Strain CCMP2564" /LENGTH=58 /DNA_ID=CAMNT_0021256409 /DNA_START=222 /DNA_END=398 /DNA_ORIENTATION=-